MGENITHNKELNRFEYITPEATAYIEYEISEKFDSVLEQLKINP